MSVRVMPPSPRTTRRVPAEAVAIGAVILEWMAAQDGVDLVLIASPGREFESVRTAAVRLLVSRQDRPAGGADRAAASRPSAGDVWIDADARVVWRGSTLVETTSVEFDLLRLLLDGCGVVVSRDRLSREVLGRPCSPADRSIDVHVSRLRRKLGPHPCGCPRIRTVRGEGYVYTRRPSP